MAFSPSTGALILQAAQGVSQVLQTQATLVQRQAEQERATTIEIANLKARNERDKIKAEIDALQKQRLEFQVSPESLARQAAAIEASTRRDVASAAKLEREAQRPPGSEKELAFLQKASHDRGIAEVFRQQFATKSSEWGFGAQKVTNEFGMEIPVDVTKTFQDEGGVGILTLDKLHRLIDDTTSDRARWLERFGPLVNQQNAQGQSIRQGIASFDQRLTALRAGVKAVGDITSLNSPSQLRALGSQGNPNLEQINSFLQQRSVLQDSYLDEVGLGVSAGLTLSNDLQKFSIAEDKKVAADSLRRHLLQHLGATKQKVGQNPAWVNFVRYARTFFETPKEADDAIQTLIDRLP